MTTAIRDKTITIRLTRTERAKLEVISSLQDLLPSQWIRNKINEEYGPDNKGPTHNESVGSGRE